MTENPAISKFGESGKCYTYTPGNKASRERARKKAAKQGAAQHANKLRKALDDILAKF